MDDRYSRHRIKSGAELEADAEHEAEHEQEAWDDAVGDEQDGAKALDPAAVVEAEGPESPADTASSDSGVRDSVRDSVRDGESGQKALAPGLYLVGTPIGNLEDITLRALRVLRGVDRIACEDTRQTQKLLNHFGITTPTISCHEHNERERTAELLETLRGGGRVAVVTDAGMPGISDPGMGLAAAAIGAGIAVTPVPGANAAVTALVASGLKTEDFRFVGFLPAKAGERRSELERLAEESVAEGAAGEPPGGDSETARSGTARSGTARSGAEGSGPTLIFYEAPHRILETLSDVEAVWGAGVRVVVARELTKLHEEFLRGTAGEVKASLAGRYRIRGEITLLVEPVRRDAAAGAAVSVAGRVKELTASEGLDEKDALKRIAKERGLSKSDVYRELQRERSSAGRTGGRA